MRAALLLALLVAAAGCGGGDDDDDVTPDAMPATDGPPVNRTDHVYVVRTAKLPATEEDVDATRFQWPNSSTPTNTMGQAITVMLGLTTGIDVQGNIDAGWRDRGEFLLYVIHSAPLDSTDANATVSVAVVEDADGDASNDFDGTGQFRLVAGEQLRVVHEGVSLADGRLEGHGDETQTVTYPLHFLELPEDPWLARGVHGYIRVDIDADGFSGAVANATTNDDLEQLGYPTLAALFTRAIELGTPNADQVSAIFDADSDGTVTVQELIESDTLASLTSPDLDLDGDDVNDHVSAGVFVDAVRAELVE